MSKKQPWASKMWELHAHPPPLPPQKKLEFNFFLPLLLVTSDNSWTSQNWPPKMQGFKGLSQEDFRAFDPLPWKFCQKMCFEASRVVFWSTSCYRELKLTTKSFTGCILCGLLIQMQNISLRSSGMHRKQNFEIVFGYKSWLLLFAFSPPLFFRFSRLLVFFC